MASKEEMKAVKPASVYSKIQMAIEERDLEETPVLEEEELVEPKLRKPRKGYTAEEIADFRKAGKTSGHKGAAMRRINMAFSDDAYEFIKRGARLYGLNMTQFVNGLILRFMDEHPEVDEAARAWVQLVPFDDDERG